MELFPQAFPDETIYSLASRYHKLAANSSYRQTSNELFGRYSRTCGSAFPCCLDALSQRLSKQLSVNHLIQEHTLLPLFAPFLNARQLGVATEAMCGTSGIGLKMSLGSTASGFEHFGSLRFCECCLAHDYQHVGQAYWHRIHQATGVLVCPYHKVVLKIVSKPRDDWRHLYLPDSLKARDVEDAVLYQDETPPLIEVARLIAWGLCNPAQVAKLLASGLLRFRLTELGMIHRDRLRLSRLDTYLNKVMEDAPRSREYQVLNSDGSRGSEWAVRLLRAQRRSYHPFRFYFLCHLLGLTPERFTESDFAFTSQDPSTRVGTKRMPILPLRTPSDSEVSAQRERFVACSESVRVHDRVGYMWLYRNDRSWLTEYIRSHRVPNIGRSHVDWAARDAELTVELQKAHDHLLQSKDRPVRISRAVLSRSVPRHYDFLRLPGKFPLSSQATVRLVETEHDFQLRKLRWVLANSPYPGRLAFSVLLRLAGIRIRHVSDVELQNLLQEIPCM
ncbi:hypothetical protein HFK74_01545|uniref:TnsD family Tn7-like transposition protein n=1 Tax=Pseudomonas sp. SbOxS1 TaxID=2723884 RepID=UPI0015D45C07|nr:hypothetical protein [Pseudomonas sp. SbOxS1]